MQRSGSENRAGEGEGEGERERGHTLGAVYKTAPSKIYTSVKNIFTKMLKDVGMEVPKQQRNKVNHAGKGRG